MQENNMHILPDTSGTPILDPTTMNYGYSYDIYCHESPIELSIAENSNNNSPIIISQYTQLQSRISYRKRTNVNFTWFSSTLYTTTPTEVKLKIIEKIIETWPELFTGLHVKETQDVNMNNISTKRKMRI